MANVRRGEIAAELGGTTRRLVLTLGALAELEAAFETADLIELAERFEAGRLSATDLAMVIGAGLRGAGETITDREAAALSIEGGAPAYVRLVSDLLAATFGSPHATAPVETGAPSLPFPPQAPGPATPGPDPATPSEQPAAPVPSLGPFPGTVPFAPPSV